MDAAQLNDVSLSGSVAASTLRENILAELEMNPNPDWCAAKAAISYSDVTSLV